MSIIVHPEVQKLKDRLAELIYEHENLISHLCPLIERRYVLEFGIYEYELYLLEFDISKLKRKLQLMRMEINHENKIDLEKIDNILSEEFEEYEQQLKAQIEEINYLKSTEIKQLSDEDSRKLKKIYRILIKKLHPDLNPNQRFYEKNMFLRATKAFQNGDLSDLEALLALTDDGEIEEESEIDDLKRLIGDFEEKIEKIKQDYPYNKKELLVDDEKGRQYKNMLVELIHDRQDDIKKLEKEIDDLNVKYSKT
ncbi:MAG: hypothetical protein J6B73_09420 [Methanobrevibacter sp.]|uniref:J domain-containing protein n=1 Tax=Methanobrevibacter millerae TaxID=230361 RepID=A0A8T3VTU3_9EURY|nr:hypothetical protein [Methanobrevibacter sp.]MBE6511315.1 hypothetical protein [Methanobrevibacter millerae]MBO5152361.1 hypothetical protein [Methanobrevibacter sp.]